MNLFSASWTTPPPDNYPGLLPDSPPIGEAYSRAPSFSNYFLSPPPPGFPPKSRECPFAHRSGRWNSHYETSFLPTRPFRGTRTIPLQSSRLTFSPFRPSIATPLICHAFPQGILKLPVPPTSRAYDLIFPLTPDFLRVFWAACCSRQIASFPPGSQKTSLSNTTSPTSPGAPVFLEKQTFPAPVDEFPAAFLRGRYFLPLLLPLRRSTQKLLLPRRILLSALLLADDDALCARLPDRLKTGFFSTTVKLLLLPL